MTPCSWRPASGNGKSLRLEKGELLDSGLKFLNRCPELAAVRRPERGQASAGDRALQKTGPRRRKFRGQWIQFASCDE